MKPNLLFDGGEATTLDLPLDFFGHGKFQMTRLGDAPDCGDAWQRDKKVVINQDRVKLPVRPAAAASN